MSFNNANIDTNNTWTTVSSGWSKNRSQQLINNSRSSSPNVPVLQTDSPVTAEMSFPLTSSSPTIDFANEIKSTRPITDPVSISTQPDLAESKPVPLEKVITIDSSVITPSTMPTPTMPPPIMHNQNSAFNMPTTARFNNWENTLENLKIQYGLIKHSIKLIEYEMGFPPELRGKTPEEKDEIISKTVYDITVEHLAKIKPVLINYKKWVDTIKPSKITGMILENCTLKEKYQRSSNKDEICKLVTQACDVLYDASTPTTQKVKLVPTLTIPKKEITITQEPVSVAATKKEVSQEQHNITFTFEQRTEHKAALHAAQEKFYDMCKPNEEEANDLKEKIKPLSDWEDCIKRINVSDDAIVIEDKYTFSKKHFLNNTWFMKRMKKDYGNMYEMNIRIHMDKTFLVITGKK